MNQQGILTQAQANKFPAPVDLFNTLTLYTERELTNGWFDQRALPEYNPIRQRSSEDWRAAIETPAP
jgi:hypothetical protein